MRRGAAAGARFECSVLLLPSTLLRSFRQTATANQVHGEAAEPVAALVVLAGDRAQAGGTVSHSRGAERGDPGVVVRQAGGDPLPHPGAGEVEAVEVRELAVGGVGDNGGVRAGARTPARPAGAGTHPPG